MSNVELAEVVDTEVRPKILFVDDEERIVRHLKMIFRRKYDVRTATSGEEALEILRGTHIHVLVSDQRMPHMTGIQLLSKAREISPNTMRLLLTGYSDLVSIIGAVNEGEVYKFLNKPWNQDEITAVIAECVEHALVIADSPPAAGPGSVPAAVAAAEAEPDAGLRGFGPPLANAVSLLALDGVASNRLEIMEMFADDYLVLGAASVAEAAELLETHNVGVIVADANVASNDTVELLQVLRRIRPALTAVVITSEPESDTVIKLINEAQIFRFAMKPVQPNIFRLAVHAAMKEHHRRLVYPAPLTTDAAGAGNGTLVQSIVTSLARFTKIW